MNFIRIEPIKTFLNSNGKVPIHELRMAFPFITLPIVSQIIIPTFKKKKTKIKLVTNLSSFNVAISLNNPCKPLIELYKAFKKDRIEIRNNPILHGKVLIADDRRAIFGSSNLTSGGETRNIEINALLRNSTNEGKARIFELIEWFEIIFEKANIIDTKQLNEISTRWENSKQRKAFLATVLPEPRLGGDYWNKVKKIAYKGKIPLKKVKILLAANDKNVLKETPKNFENKLLFLQELGIVSYWDDDWVYCSPEARKLTKSQEHFFPILSQLVPAVTSVLQIVKRKKKTTYKELHSVLLNSFQEQDIHIATNWLLHLGFLTLEKPHREYVFRITNLGEKYRLDY